MISQQPVSKEKSRIHPACSLWGTNLRVSPRTPVNSLEKACLFTTNQSPCPPSTCYQMQPITQSDFFICMAYFLQKKCLREQDAKLPYITETDLQRDYHIPLPHASSSHSKAAACRLLASLRYAPVPTWTRGWVMEFKLSVRSPPSCTFKHSSKSPQADQRKDHMRPQRQATYTKQLLVLYQLFPPTADDGMDIYKEGHFENTAP